MNTDPISTEQMLRSLRWRQPPPEFLRHTLAAALAEREKVVQSFSSHRSAKPHNHRLKPLSTLLALIPRPIRWPLAACWLLAFFFRLTTPEAIPQSTLEKYAKLPPVTPAQLLAHLEHAERLAHELLEQLRSPQPPL
ncbi:hypothetical protein [Prosthecobacter sp.]|uniref:hypothetical protein n=1 Tax=Prosthecobacter sp. TaxID=1965333 RepID=UPI002ABBFDEC|nr:hypothetical protein [Prosthecobacter sp.]MDZ4401457.1 hypothetical protein [Prosthecobacter sp.]